MKKIILLFTVFGIALNCNGQTPVLIATDPSMAISISNVGTSSCSTLTGASSAILFDGTDNNTILNCGTTSPYNTTEIIIDTKSAVNLKQIIIRTANTYMGSLSLSSSFSTLGPWVNISTSYANYTTVNGAYNHILNVTSPKVARYWKLSLPVYSNTSRISLDEIYLYKYPTITASGSTLLISGQCVTLTAAASGETYLWSTGATTQSITVCNSGNYTCQVTNTSFTGNQDHSCSISVSQIGNQDNFPGPNGEIYAVFKSGNNVYIGGDFNAFGTITGSGAKIDTTGSANINLPRVVGTIFTTISDGHGGWFIGGSFSKVGNYIINNLAHIKSDNSVDLIFKPEPNGIVNTLALYGTSLYAGGEFTTIKGLTNNYLAKLSSANGDASFWNANANGSVKSIQLYSDQIIVGGNFTSLGGLARNYLGSVDTTFVQATSWNPNPNATVYKVYVSGSKLYAGGDFTTISGSTKHYGCGFTLPAYTTDGYDIGADGRIHDFLLNGNILYAAGFFKTIGGASRSYLAAMNYLNAVANTFNANSDGLVNAISVLGNKLIVGGNFSNIGGVARNKIAALNLTTGIATSWNPNVIGLKNGTTTQNYIFNGGNSDIFKVPYGCSAINIIATGASGGSTTGTSGGNGGYVSATYPSIYDQLFYINVGSAGGNSSSGGSVYYGTGGAIIGGAGGAGGAGGGGASDIRLGGTALNNRIIVAGGGGGAGNSNGGSACATGGYGGGGTGGSGSTCTSTGSPGGGGSQVAGGAGGNSGGHSGSLGNGGNGGLISGGWANTGGGGGGYYGGGGGGANTTYNYGGPGGGGSSYIDAAATNVGNYIGINSGNGSVSISYDPTSILCLAIDTNSIYAGGNFYSVGSLIRNNLAAIDATTGNITSWNPNVNGIVRSLFADTNYVYAGGDFTLLNGSITKNRIAQINISSAIPTGWNPNANGSVDAITMKGNTLFVAGAFSNIGGAARAGLASLSTSTGAATSFNPAPNGNVYALTIGGDTLYIGGAFTSIGGQTRNRVASYNITSSVLTSLDPNADNVVNALSYYNNKLYIGGSFTHIANNPLVNLASYNVLSNTITSFNMGVNSTSGVNTLFTKDSSLYQGGGFNYYNQGNPINNLAAVNVASNYIGYWQPQPDDIVRTIYATSSKVYMGGRFKNILNRYQPFFASADVFINSPPPAIISISATNACANSTITITGSGFIAISSVKVGTIGVPYTIVSETTITIQPGSAMSGTIAITNQFGTATSSQTLTVNALPTITASATSSSICSGAAETLTGSGASSYVWSNGLTNGVAFNPTTTATYTVTGTDGNGCVNTATQLITVNALPIVTATATATSVCIGGSVTLTGGGAVSYVWTYGVTNGVAFAPTITRGYVVTGTDANGCSNSASKTIAVNQLPNVTANASSAPVCSGAAETLTGSGALSYVWSNGVTNGTVFHPTATSTYTVTGTDGNGCVNTSTQLITVNALPTVIANATSSAICFGGSVTLTGGGASSYVWSGSVTDGIAFNPTITNSYTVTGTDGNGCANTFAKLIFVNGLPTVTASSTAASLCIGGATTLTGGGASSYSWSDGVTNAVAFNPSSTHTYTVTGTNGNGCVNTATKTITVNQLPTVMATASSATVCSGVAETLSGSGASSYIWSNGVTNGTVFHPTATNTYTVTGTDGNGCVNTATQLITVNALPTVIANATSSAICFGGSVTLTGGGASSYVWSGSVTDGIAFNPTITNTYTVTGTDGNGCLNTATQLITVNALPSVTANATAASVCIGGTTTLTGGGATSYVWSDGVTNAVAFNPSSTHTYTVTGTNGNGCVNTATKTITVNQLPTVMATASSATVCNGAAETLSGSGASSYIWSNGVTNGTVFHPTTTNTYTVTGTDGNGCINTATQLITVNALPTVIANATSSAICFGGSVTLTGGGAASYIWSGGITDGVAFNPNTTATYTVTGTDGNGCSNTATKTITVNALPTVTANATNTSLCIGGATTLTGGGASSYVWSGSVTDGIAFNPTITNTYTVTGTDGNGCVNTATKTITVNPLPTINVASGATTFCSNSASTALVGLPSGGSWSGTGVSGNSFNPSVSGAGNFSATYTYTNGNSCTNTGSIQMTVNAAPSLSVAAADTLFCINHASESLIALPSGGTWSGAGISGNTFVPSVAGIGVHSITYSYTDVNGCTNTASLNMTVDLCTGINTLTDMNDIVIYPNPFTEQTTISFSEIQKNTTIKIMDVTGREIKNLELIIKNEKSVTLDMSSYAKGIYFVQITDENKKIINKKIVIQ